MKALLFRGAGLCAALTLAVCLSLAADPPATGKLDDRQDFVFLGVLEHLREVGAATLEPILELCSRSTCGSSLLQRGRALLVGQLGKGHDSSVSHRWQSIFVFLGRVLQPAGTTVLTLPDEI